VKNNTNWKKVTSIVVLALSILSSTVTAAALHVPHRDTRHTAFYADVCVDSDALRFEQYLTAIEGVEELDSLLASCDVNAPTRFEQELAAIAPQAGAYAQTWMAFAQSLDEIDGMQSVYTGSRVAERGALNVALSAPSAGAHAQAWIDLSRSFGEDGTARAWTR
jgi:hypothetical protein